MTKTKNIFNTVQELFSSNGILCHYLKNYITPEKIFLFFCLFWGIILAFINPLFQSFDEPEHFYKIYGFTNGTMNFKKITSYTDGTLLFKEPKTFSAQIIPVSIVQISVENKKLNAYFDENKTVYKPEKLRIKDAIRQYKMELNKNFRTIVVHVIPSYTIASYLPHTIMLTVLKYLDTKPAYMIFILRLCSLFLYITLVYNAIKITPVKKYLFLLLSIAPLSVYLSSTINTDHLVIGLAFLLIAYTLKLKYDENIKNITPKNIIFFTLLILWLCICKFTYLPLILLFFILPHEKFKNKKYQSLCFVIPFIICTVWIALYLSYNLHIFKGVFTYFSKDTSIAIKSIFTAPLSYITSIVKTIIANQAEYTKRIFSDFGSSDTQISSGIIYSFITLIILNILFADKQKTTFNLKEKLIFVFIILSVLTMTLTANYIIFILSPEGLIEGFKGRYLIPVLPLFFMLFDNNKLKPIKINLPLFTVLYAFFFLIVFSVCLINRYYII